MTCVRKHGEADPLASLCHAVPSPAPADCMTQLQVRLLSVMLIVDKRGVLTSFKSRSIPYQPTRQWSWSPESIASPSSTTSTRRSYSTKPESTTQPPTTPTIPPQTGTAPFLVKHLILHTPNPISSFPSHLEAVSPLYKALLKKGRKEPALEGYGVGFAEGGEGEERVWDSGKSRFQELISGKEGEVEESYKGFIYPDFTPIGPISISKLSSTPTAELLSPSSSIPTPSTSNATTPRTHIYICTHGSRDCRCSDLGEPLYQALLREIQKRKVGGEMEKGDYQVSIGRIGHVGGHKWAGNALVYREGGPGEWYGLLRSTDALPLLTHVLSPTPTTWWARWRGRLGLTPREVKELYLSENGTGKVAAVGGGNLKKEKMRGELGERVALKFETWDGGDVLDVWGYEGESIMEAARRNNLPAIEATCGGFCECATCHVHIPVNSTAASSSSLALPKVSEEEEEQLDFAMGRKGDSRLSCQIPVTKELGKWIEEGGRIRLPRY